MYANLRIKISKFLKKNRNKIIIIAIIWAIVIVINYIIAHRPIELRPIVSYNPQNPIVTADKVPEKLQEPITSLLDEFINTCNKKQYEKAYGMLSEECKTNLYPDIDTFKTYVDSIFDAKKIYNIQNYSNSRENNTYIYSVRILDDIMATGMTGMNNELKYYEEKYVIKETNNGLTLSIGEYISNEKPDNIYEDEYMKIDIMEKSVKYDTENYTVKITSRTNNVIVLSDLTERNEICLSLDNNDIRNNGIKNSNLIVLQPMETRTFELEFNKYYDESSKSTGIIFNAVRVLKSYSMLPELRQQELDEAVKLYSFEMKF